MDVRCEKCQTEYELDEARLKPGGVTVKCTHCGHMFKIRKRTLTNVGTTPPVPSTLAGPAGPPIPSAPRGGRETVRPRAALGKPRADSMLEDSSSFDDIPTTSAEEPPTTVERHWLIRLENGEQKTCSELATLQQWIITSVVTREALISRTGKTWKRLGDIADLGQYFAIADEARANRGRTRQASRPGPRDHAAAPPGYSAAGGTIVPDDDGEEVTRSRAPHRAVAPTPPPPPPSRGVVRTPPGGAPILGNTPIPLVARTPAAMSATVPQTGPVAPPQRGPRTTPPRPPVPHGKRVVPPSGPVPHVAQPPAIPPPQIGRETAAWAVDAIQPSGPTTTQPFTGNLSAVPDEPAFAGRVRIAPGDESTFATGKVRALDDDDGVLRVGRSSRAGMLVLVMALLVMGAGAAVVYLFVIRPSADDHAAPTPSKPNDERATSATPVAPAPPAAVAPAPPAAVVPAASLDAARGELAGDLEPRLRTAAQALEPAADPASLALRSQLLGQLAQDLQDRAQVSPDRAEGEALRTTARQLVLDAATAAQRALKAAGDDAGANLAMAGVLRLQGKPAHEVARYLEIARAKGAPASKRELALGDALVLVRDGKLDDARAALAAIDQGDDKLEASGDVRARLHLAFVLAAQNKPDEARPLVDSVLAARPDHAAARALAAKLETAVAKTDPLPQEDGAPSRPPPPPAAPAVAPRPGAGGGAGGDSYERLLARANAVADTSCTKAMELYAKALEQKPNGAEALTGMGYCHVDAKQFASAFSKFRSALAVSPRYEPALRGIAEAYQQQGRREQAIEAYRAYLEAYPNSAAAKKQLERLGGDTAPPSAPAAPPAATPSGPVTEPGAGSAPG